MKTEIPIYRAEIDSGIAPLVKAGVSIAYLVPISPISESDQFKIKSVASADVPAESYDQYFLKDILVTTGWNKNDDIFDRAETWAARHTSVDKPFNFEHNQNDIIGHIVGSQVVSDEMETLDDDLAIEDLPDRFHIMNGSVIYRNIGDEARQELIEATIAEIKSGEWYVSMECFLTNFDYGVIQPDGTQSIIARNEETAWLTKYLRAYPPDPEKPIVNKYFGSGIYKDDVSGDEYRIGRLARNIMFCGKGLVRMPANPDSVILNNVAKFNASQNFLVYKSMNAHISNKENLIMADVSDELKVANDTIASLRSEIETHKTKNFDTQIANLKVEVGEKDKQINSLSAQVTEITKASTALSERAETAEAELKLVKTKLEEVVVASTKTARIEQAMKKGADVKSAEALVANLIGLTDEAFASTLEVVASSFKPVAAKTDIAKIDAAVVEHDATLATDPAVPTTAVAGLGGFLSKNILGK